MWNKQRLAESCSLRRLDVCCISPAPGKRHARVCGHPVPWRTSPQTMSWGEAQFTPGELTEAVQGVRECSLLPLLAGGEAVSPAVEIAQGEEGRLLIRWFVTLCWG